MKELWKWCLVLGSVSGCLEMGLRAESRLGLGTLELLQWLLLAVLMGCLVTFPAGLVASWMPQRRHGLVLSALLAVHAGLAYRFEVVLNLFVKDPMVWGGLLGIALGSLALGLLLDPWLRKVESKLWPLALVGALLGFIRGMPPGALSAQERPNVLIITLDTTRPDQLSVYGGEAQTPYLESLAEEGVLFEQAVATAPLTEPSHLAILSGSPPHITGVVSNGTRLGDRPDLLSHRMQDAGYRTGGFISGFPLHGKWGWTQGFDVYDDDFGVIPGLHRLSLMRLYEQLFVPGNTLRERYGRYTIARSLEFLRRQKGGSWFAWIHLFDPHAPYEVSEEQLAVAPRQGEPLDLPEYWPPPYRSVTDIDWILKTYHQELELTDSLVGQVFDHLRATGEWENTMVIVTADHGESLTEHDYLFDHGDYLYDASLRIPLIIKHPGLSPKEPRTECQVSAADILPTVVEWLDLPVGGETGTSFAPQLRGDPCRSEPVLSSTIAGRYMERPPVDRSLRSPESKYIYHEDGGHELYDLREDPNEERDLSGEDPGTAGAARRVLLSRLEGATEVEGPEMDAATIETLRALGYVE